MQDGRVGQRNERIIRTLDSRIQTKVRTALSLAGAAGHTLVVYQGRRTYHEQDSFYAIGRGSGDTRRVVTHGSGGQSPHNYGLAVDAALAPLEGRAIDWHGDFTLVHDAGVAAGLESGADWPQPKTDLPHLQMPGWRTLIP